MNSGGDLSKLITITGAADDDGPAFLYCLILFFPGLPGKPGFLQCPDQFGKEWRATVRVLDELPADMWSLPLTRVDAGILLTDTSSFHLSM